jgi:hypothetical protein
MFFSKSNVLREWPCQYIWALIQSMGIKRLWQKRNSCIKLLICLILDIHNLAVRPHLFEFQVFNINFSMNADDIKN